MIKSTSPSPKPLEYVSIVWRESRTMPGVRYAIHRMSLMQRIALTGSIRELTSKHEFLRAGDAVDQVEATLSELLVKRLYLEWGLDQIHGLEIDGNTATSESLIAKGPEALTDEIVIDIQSELGLSDEETKNF